MRKTACLVLFFLVGCAGGPAQPEPDVADTVSAVDTSDIDVFLEEPSIEYESLGRVGMTSRAEHPAEVLNAILVRAGELGADGVIVHSIRNQGRVGQSTDSFGTGGGTGYLVFQIQATAIRYAQGN